MRPALAFDRDSLTDPVGEWRRPAKGIHVQLYRCGASVCGRIVRLKDTSRQDANNPEPRLRTRPWLGVQVLHGLAPADTGGWEAELYNPQTGRRYGAQLVPDGPNHLRVTTCRLMGLICTSETWTRVR